MVFSGYRFARLAKEANIPIIIINRGRTRADEIASPETGWRLHRDTAARSRRAGAMIQGPSQRHDV